LWEMGASSSGWCTLDGGFSSGRHPRSRGYIKLKKPDDGSVQIFEFVRKVLLISVP